jgi:hypothetical protein
MQLNERRTRLEQKQADDSDIRDDIDSLQFWCDEVESDMLTSVDPSNRAQLLDLLQRITVSICSPTTVYLSLGFLGT